MKTNRPLWTFRLLALSVSLVISAMGCATHTARSYNQDFGQSLPTDPKYFIENVDDNHFKLTLHQGSTEQGSQRVIDMKNAAPVIADAEAKPLGSTFRINPSRAPFQATGSGGRASPADLRAGRRLRGHYRGFVRPRW